MNLGTRPYQPYRQPDNMLVYINRKSNYPPTITKEIPKALAKRTADISSSENVFNYSIPIYSEPLTQRQTRKRHISIKSYGSILHHALVLKQMLEGYS